MSSNGQRPFNRTFSGIDDGLDLLLSEGHQEGVQGSLELHSFMPLASPAHLGADQMGRSAATPSGAGAGTTVACIAPFPAAAAGPAALKSSGKHATPMAPATFVPLQLPGKAVAAPHSAGDGVPASLLALTSPGLQLQPSGGSFTIPAYGRPLTQLDFISTDDLDDLPGTAGAAAMVHGSACGGRRRLSDFGDLGDVGRLGELPTDDDLKLLLFEPLASPRLPLAGAGRSGTGGSGSLAGFGVTGSGTPALGVDMHIAAAQRAAAHQQPALFYQQAAAAAAAAASSGYSGGAIGVGGIAQAQSLAPSTAGARASGPALRIKIDLSAVAAGSSSMADRQPSPVGSLKRRVDRLGLDSPPGSPRNSKRHSSGGSSLWGGDDCSDDEGESPRSSTPRSGAAGGGYSSTSGPSRFGQEQSRLKLASHGSAATEGTYPSRSSSWEQQGARPAPRQQQYHQQPQQQYMEQAPHSYFVQQPAVQAVTAEEAPVQQFRGVSRHRLTQRWEASLWLNGRQLYLGGFNSQEDAAHAYDLAALACKGPDAQINFLASDYEAQLREIQGYSRDEVVAYVRRRSSAFSRGKSRYRGVSGHNGRWEARIGSFGGRKNVSFGVFESEEEAARQYDRALILEKGRSAKTNFPTRDYEREVAEYEAHLLATCHAMHGSATLSVASTYTLPTYREATADEKKRSAVIYAEALRRVLQQSMAFSGSRR